MMPRDEHTAGYLFNLGLAAYHDGQLENAIKFWESAETIYLDCGLEREAADCTNHIGSTLWTLGRPQQAIELHEKAKTVYLRLKLEKGVADCDISIGVALKALWKLRQAIEHFERANTTYRRLGFKIEEADSYTNIGNAFGALGQWEEMIKHNKRAKAVYLSLNLEKDAADCDVNIGAALHALGHSQQAKGHFERAKIVYFNLRINREVAGCDMNIGTTLTAIGQPREAKERFEQAKAIFLHLGFDKEVADCDVNIGNALNSLWQPRQAFKCYERAEAVYHQLGFDKEAATCEMGIGISLLYLGQPREAKEHFERARAEYRRLDLKQEMANCDANVGATLQTLGQSQQAIEYCERAIETYSRLKLDKEVAGCNQTMGVAFMTLGQLRQAIECHERAKAVYLDLGLEKEAAGCDMGIGAALWSSGWAPQAIEHYKQARSVFHRLNLDKKVADCDKSIGCAFNSLGQPQQARDYNERARAIYIHFGFDVETAGCDMNIGNALDDLGQPQQAIEHYERAKAVYIHLGFGKEAADCDKNIGITLARLAAEANPKAARDMYQQALIHLDRAISTFEQLRTNISVITYRISFFEQFVGSYSAAIYSCLRLGRIAEAIHYLERSRSKVLAEAISGNLIPDRNEVGEELYSEFFNLRSRLRQHGLLTIAGAIAESQITPYERVSDRVQAQHDFDALAQRIAIQFPNSAFAQRLKASEVRYLKNADEYVGLLPDNRSCLLGFLTWADDGRLRAFLVTKQRGLELLTFPEGSLKQLEALLDDWKEMYVGKLTAKGKADLVWKTCHQLQKLIFDAEIQISREGDPEDIVAEVGRWKLRDYLDTTLEAGDKEQPRRMYLIPHSFLFLMPLHAACYDEETQPRPHYLIDDYTVVYAPSAYLLKVSQDRKYSKPQQPRAIVVGNPQPLPDEDPLPGATKEARVVAKQLRGAGWRVDELIETAATKQRFLNGDGNGVAGINSSAYFHLHLAQHAGIGNRGHQAYLCFGKPSEDALPEQYLCETAEIAGAPLQRTSSALIAGCLTSFTPPSLNEYLGTSAAFLQAGVGTCIGTIYALSDAGSSRLMPKLYCLHLEKGLSWADALRQAQLWMIGDLAAGATKYARRAPTMTAEKLEQTVAASESEKEEEKEPPLDHPYHWAAFTLSGKA